MTVTSEHPNARIAPIGADLVRNQSSGVNTFAQPIHRSHSHRSSVAKAAWCSFCASFSTSPSEYCSTSTTEFSISTRRQEWPMPSMFSTREILILLPSDSCESGHLHCGHGAVALYHLWTPLASHMFSASLVSAAAMAGAVYQVRCTLTEWGVHAAPRITLVILLALNGMIVLYGGNGMSKSVSSSRLATCQLLLRWLQGQSVVVAGIHGRCFGTLLHRAKRSHGPASLGVSWCSESDWRGMSDPAGVACGRR